MSKTLALKPHMSEKAYSLSLDTNTYVFDVPVSCNKQLIKQAIVDQFKVKVLDVRLVNVKGKVKKSYQKRNKPIYGKRANTKKAYVSLVSGETINIFGDDDKDNKNTAKKASVSKKKETK